MTDLVRQKMVEHMAKAVRAHRAKTLGQLVVDGVPVEQARGLATRRTRAAMQPKVEALAADFPIHAKKARQILRDTLGGFPQ
jgi:hypothetical protein